jgi:hypothetical protein
MAELDSEDLDGLASAPILAQARSLQGLPAASLPESLLERLNKGEVGLIEEISRQSQAPADPADCIRTLKRLRYDRERAEVQREIDRLQETGLAGHEMDSLLRRKHDLLYRIEALID